MIMVTGFFSIDDIELVRGDEKNGRIKSQAEANCTTCGLYENCTSPKIKLAGEGNKKILFISEYPTGSEDDSGIQFYGRSGEILKSILKELNLNLDDDFWSVFAVRCKPEDKVTGIHIAACRKKLLKAIYSLQPAVIIPLGKIAMDTLVGYRMTGRLSGISMVDWVGCQIPDQELKCFICPTWNLSYALKDKGKEGENSVIKNQIFQHIKTACRLSDVSFYQSNYLSDCFVLKTVTEAMEILQQATTWKVISFDYETTGKKPHRDGHEIYSVAISNGIFGWSFPYFNDVDFRKCWLKLMNSKIPKIAHNAKFESTWTKIRGGFNNKGGLWPNNIIWDTMLAMTILDNRKKSNLKFGLYSIFGMAGYDSAVDKYLECSKEEEKIHGANGINRIKDAPLDELLKYGAMDALGTYKMWEYQTRRMSEPMKSALSLFDSGSLSFAKAEEHGLVCSVSEVDDASEEISATMKNLEQAIVTDQVLDSWDKKQAYRPSAPGDLSHLLFDLLKYDTGTDRTATNKYKADADSLSAFSYVPIVKNSLDWRKWKKVRDTYLHGFQVESVNGIIHPFFNLHTVSTYRSSSDAPNFQNIPKRDAKVATLLRKLLKPSPGNRLGEYDYKAMETVINGCYNKDPNWIRYISDPKNDMHRDMGAKIFIKSSSDITKSERQLSKSNFVFPTIYGSWYGQTGPNIWSELEDSTKKHLKIKGIKNVDDFISHMKKVERWFFEDQFPVAFEWREKTIHDYEKCGYIDLYTGFRCRGPMSRNQLLNYQTQGTAFHCLLWTFIQVTNQFEKNKMDAYFTGQIHDAMLPDYNPEEEAVVDHLIWLYGTQKIREHWEWINAPLSIEKSRSAIDGDWSEMENCGLLSE